METKYSKEKFDGFTHRFMIRLSVDEDWINDSTITLYSNSGSEDELVNFIKERKSAKVKEFSILHKASKEQDELDTKLIDELLANDGF